MTRIDGHEGMRIVVTGANTGIGRAAALTLAQRGAHVVLACRSAEKTRPVLEEIARAGGSAEHVELDLADLDSVRRCAAQLRTADAPIDVLLNNAGLAGSPGTTKQGFELTFGVNHLGHFLLTRELQPLLERSAAEKGVPARVVNVSSRSHYSAKGIDWSALRAPTKSLTGLPEYAVSKLCNVLFTVEKARREGTGKVHTYALHPGVIASDAWRQIPWPARSLMKLFMRSNEEGAKTSIHCATAPDTRSSTGLYYDSCREKAPSKLAYDHALAAELWAKSEEWTRA